MLGAPQRANGACDGRVHGLHDLEVGGEKDVEVALVDLVLVSM